MHLSKVRLLCYNSSMIKAYIQKKLKFPLPVVFGSAVLCGVMMGIVSEFSIVAANINPAAPILGRVLYGVAFTGLLFTVLMNGYELFTGNTMLLIEVHKKEQTKKILLNVLLVYVGNFIGCIVFAAAIYYTKLHDKLSLVPYLENLYNGKTGLSVGQMLVTGFFANYLVCMGVHLGNKGKTSLETYINLFFPIAIFCVLGFEHSVANMYSLFYAAMVTGKSVGPAFFNLLFVTIGNIAGGVCLALSTKLKDKLPPPEAPPAAQPPSA